MDEELAEWLYLFNRGQDNQSFRRFGAHRVGSDDWQFLVWAPHAQAVAVVGEFSGWQPVPLSKLGATGCWRGEHQGVAGQLYKIQMTTRTGEIVEKIDPYAFAFEKSPAPRLGWPTCRGGSGGMAPGWPGAVRIAPTTGRSTFTRCTWLVQTARGRQLPDLPRGNR